MMLVISNFERLNMNGEYRFVSRSFKKAFASKCFQEYLTGVQSIRCKNRMSLINGGYEAIVRHLFCRRTKLE